MRLVFVFSDNHSKRKTPRKSHDWVHDELLTTISAPLKERDLFVGYEGADEARFSLGARMRTPKRFQLEELELDLDSSNGWTSSVDSASALAL